MPKTSEQQGGVHVRAATVGTHRFCFLLHVGGEVVAIGDGGDSGETPREPMTTADRSTHTAQRLSNGK